MPLLHHTMDPPTFSSHLLLSHLIILLASTTTTTLAGEIGVYWGHTHDKPPLLSICASGNYTIVNLALLTTSTNTTLTFNLTGDCSGSHRTSSGGCLDLSNAVQFCQSRNVKVLLSVGGGGLGNHTLTSTKEVKHAANFLWKKFLGGESSRRLLGDAVLDGVNFDDVEWGNTQLLGELAKQLAAYSRRGKKVYLTAAPRCPFPDRLLGFALYTGVFDYVWVQFYNSTSCQYGGHEDGDVGRVIDSWKVWAKSVPAPTEILLGLPAAPDVAGGGYIPAGVLVKEVIPVVKRLGKYGGVMLWSRYFGRIAEYTSLIRDYV